VVEQVSRDRALRLFVAIGIVAPALVAIACLVGRRWHPTDDLAIIDLRSRDVWTTHTPLTGLYSRPGWNHPGPLMFWMIGGVAGQAPWATRIAGPIIQGVALGWLAWTASRRGLRMLLAAGTVASLTYLGINSEVFRQPWNLYLPLPLLVLFVFLVCIVATGGFRQLIAMSITGSIIVQTHVGFAPLVVAGFAWALGCVIHDWRREQTVPERWRSTVALAVALPAVAWIPPLIGAIVQTPGNLGSLVRYFTSGSHPSVGLHPAVGIMAAEFRIVPPWLGGAVRLRFLTDYVVPSPAWLLLVPGGLLALGAVAARRSHSRDDARMVGFAALLVLVSIVAISRADEALAYTLQWRLVVAAFVVVASVWSSAAAIDQKASPWPRVGAVVLVVGVIAWGCGVRAVSERAPVANDQLEVRDSALANLMGQLEREGLPGPGQLLVRAYGTTLPHLFDGVVNALDRHGVDVRVDRALARVFGSQRVGTVARTNEVWYVAEEGWVKALLLRIPGARVIASTTPLSPSDDEELSRLQAKLREQLVAARRPDLGHDVESPLIALFTQHVSGVDQETARRVAQLSALAVRNGGCRCSIIAIAGPGRFQTPPRLPRATL